MTPEQERLVLEALPLLDRLVRGFLSRRPTHVDGDAIRGAAHEALVKCALTFDATRGVPFDAWANQRIAGAMLDEIRSITYGPRGERVRVVEIQPADATTPVGRVDALLDLRAGLAELAPVNRRIVLATFAGYQLQELGAELGITISAVSLRKLGAFKRLRKSLAA